MKVSETELFWGVVLVNFKAYIHVRTKPRRAVIWVGILDCPQLHEEVVGEGYFREPYQKNA